MRSTLLFVFFVSLACDQDDIADACPDLPSTDAVFFPIEQSRTWEYALRFEHLIGPRENPTHGRTTDGKSDWEVADVRCESGEFRFDVTSLAVGNTVDIDFLSGEEVTDFVVNTGVVEGQTVDGPLRLQGFTGAQTTGLGSANFLIPLPRWHYPMAVGNTVTVDTTWVAQIGSEALLASSHITLVREQGIIAWYARIGTETDSFFEEARLEQTSAR